MDLGQIRQTLLDVCFVIQHLSAGQIKNLCQFVAPKNWVDLNITQISNLIRAAGEPDLERLIEEASKRFNVDDSGPDQDKVDLDVEQFVEVYHMALLQHLLKNLTDSQLMKLWQVLPASGNKIEQLQYLEQIQQLLVQISPDNLQTLQVELRQVAPGTEQSVLVHLVELDAEFFHLYEALRYMLQLETNELLTLQDILPKLQFIQRVQIVRLREAGEFASYDFRNLLVPETPNGTQGGLPPGADPLNIALHDGLGPHMDDGGDDMDQDEPTLRLEIVEQPPEKCVYKRNIKPAPTVMVVGEQGNGDANVFVAVTLTRCDTGELQTKLLTGNKPVQVASGRVIPFKRLKILVTSHQMNETLFSLRFELRRYNSDSPDDYELLQSIASNPICVLSHSTQLKPSSSISPVVLEVLPMSGPPTGFTRVAVLGANFVESPTTRVKFDNTEVIPIFHGPKTLICHTPKHAPGIVEVRVCNDAKKWSESCAHFKYDDNVPIDDDKQASGSDQQLRHGSSGVWETAFEGGYETVRVLQSQPSLTHRLGQLPSSQQTQVAQSLRRAAQSLDSRGYASLHYAASYNLTGLSHWLIVSLKLDAAILDKEGNTPLHWAAWNGQLEACQFFVAAAQVNPDIQNAEGQTALHLAAASGHIRVVDFLLRSNADPNITNMDGHSALLSAIIAESPSQIIELLVSGGAHLNTQDNVGDAPLHWAVRGSAAATIEYLLKQGAYTEEANEDGETPLTLAMICSDSDSANALLRFGASYHRSMLAVNTQQHHDESCMMYDDAESSDGTEEEYFDEEIMTDTNDSWSSSSRTMACGRMSSMVMSDDEVMVQPKPALLRRDLSCGGTGLLAQGMEQCSISSQ